MLPPATQSHPHPRQLERFMTSQLHRSEVRRVIRHLLMGCPVCSRVTRQLWRFGAANQETLRS